MNNDTIEFYTKPLVEVDEATIDDIKEVKMSDIDKLVYLALSFNPHQEVSEELGYTSALNKYFTKNKDHPLYDAYSIVGQNVCGQLLLIYKIGYTLLVTKNPDFSKDGLENIKKVSTKIEKVIEKNNEIIENVKDSIRKNNLNKR